MAAAYRKIHLFDVELAGRVSLQESSYTHPGSDIAPPVSTSVGKVRPSRGSPSGGAGTRLQPERGQEQRQPRAAEPCFCPGWARGLRTAAQSPDGAPPPCCSRGSVPKDGGGWDPRANHARC